MIKFKDSLVLAYYKKVIMNTKLNLILSVLILLTLSCGQNKKAESMDTDNEIMTIQPRKINPSELKKYTSVKAMLEDAHDFTLEQGTLKFINSDENNLHIQVSKPIIEGDFENVISSTVKRDIVYVAFQTFAKTSTNKITITSVPIDINNQAKYYNEYQKTVTVTKEKANQIMQNEFGSVDYSILFADLNGIQIPSNHFDKLKFENLDRIYSELAD